uniref:Uncharacterized protein n=1 Tax=Lactuca sativa TaxID=4236 RepID=A0A9R1WFA8_LACSA|nr:hypothetical protein LSAT_V11C100027310 [Lactuca sativa]
MRTFLHKDRQVPRSRRSREVRFPSRSSAREKFDFRGDLPDLLRITTSASRSAVRSSSDQILAPLPIGFAVFLVHLATIPITGTGCCFFGDSLTVNQKETHVETE